ncbi:MAG: Uma2 family endonuclease [Lachnospiraceae bacterium]|nr:Uma2 family endonuclease [Lachnospiraceae bacterium]
MAEVTSESTRKNDYGKKMITYSEIGVKEYWVVDLQRN